MGSHESSWWYKMRKAASMGRLSDFYTLLALRDGKRVLPVASTMIAASTAIASTTMVSSVAMVTAAVIPAAYVTVTIVAWVSIVAMAVIAVAIVATAPARAPDAAAIIAVIPGAGANEDAVHEVAWAVIAGGRAGVRIVAVVAIGANGGRADANSDADANLRAGIRRGEEENECSQQDSIF